MKCRIVTHLDGVLHILRNPHGFTEDVVRQARLDAADCIEALREALQDAVKLLPVRSDTWATAMRALSLAGSVGTSDKLHCYHYPQCSEGEDVPDLELVRCSSCPMKNGPSEGGGYRESAPLPDEQMCPNCVTPWKCNGPHIPPPARVGEIHKVAPTGPYCVGCDGTGWCEGSPAFTCERCRGSGLDSPPPGGGVSLLREPVTPPPHDPAHGQQAARGPRDHRLGETEMKTFDVNYFQHKPGGERTFSHKHSETWTKDSAFCPHCGKQEVWTEVGDGDYYAGPNFACVACGAIFNLPHLRTGLREEADRQRIEHLREPLKPADAIAALARARTATTPRTSAHERVQSREVQREPQDQNGRHL